MGLALERLPDWPVAMSRELALAYTGAPHGRMMAKMLAGIAQFERDMLQRARPVRPRRGESAGPQARAANR